MSTEGNQTQTEPETTTTETAPAAETPPVATPEAPAASSPTPERQWDLTRQYRDELAAANRREGEIRAQLAQQQAALQQMQQQQTQGQEVDLNDYDTLVTEVKKLKTTLTEQNKLVQEQRQAIEQERARINAAEGQRELNKVLDRLDQEIDPRFRNDAYKEVEAEYVAQGIAQLPDKPRREWIEKALKVAYLERERQGRPGAATKPAATTATAAPAKVAAPKLDTGQGGETPSDELPDNLTVAQYRELRAKRDERMRQAKKPGWV